ncbi:MAG: M48 family metallopeptidase [Patescibacteria group bacterium]|nr:M48 family metallopeptidase [Patescibacteria group bacterium]
MNLYTQAESNTRKTYILMLGFFIFIIAFGWFFSLVMNNNIILIIAVVLSIVMSFTSYWYSDKIVLKMANAKMIEKKDNPELYRIVENLCITAGLPLPKIFIMDEAQPNAFATGRDANHAVVAVTKGLLEKLNRVELEGVIAHELSHIGNKDMLLQTVIVVLVGVVAILSDFFLRISFWGGLGGDNDSRGNTALFVLGIIAAILAPIAAMLMKMAISRKREFLADASGALLTRYPEGLASALEKISADTNSIKRANNSTAHLYISNPFKGKKKTSWFTKLFLTHPPAEQRIQALRGMKIE